MLLSTSLAVRSVNSKVTFAFRASPRNGAGQKKGDHQPDVMAVFLLVGPSEGDDYASVSETAFPGATIGSGDGEGEGEGDGEGATDSSRDKN